MGGHSAASTDGAPPSPSAASGACPFRRACLPPPLRLISHLISQEIDHRDASSVFLFFMSVFFILVGLVSLAFIWPGWLVTCLGDGDQAICGSRDHKEFVDTSPLAGEEDGERDVNECVRCSWGCSK